jgi:hypothetical protein
MVLGERLQVLQQNAFAAERRVTDRQTRLSEFIYKKIGRGLKVPKFVALAY